ncbi:MAG: Wzz/FepE/Etk N-terminal domain-containing protein, partial [Pseudomonadota bacterium]
MEDDEQGINLRDWRDAVLRRWFLFVLIVPVTTAIGVIVAFSLPSVYASTARVLVESQAIPTQLAPTTVGTNASERLRVLEQRLTARANMLEVIDRLKLFANAPGMTATQKVNIMKANTSIASISSGSRRGPG